MKIPIRGYAGGVSEFPETPPERHGLARTGLARTMHTRERSASHSLETPSHTRAERVTLFGNPLTHARGARHTLWKPPHTHEWSASHSLETPSHTQTERITRMTSLWKPPLKNPVYAPANDIHFCQTTITYLLQW